MGLKERVKNVLERKGYEVFEYSGCFDIVGKKSKMLLIKVLKNIDGFLRQHASSLKSVSWGLGAYSFLIGENTNYEKLRTGVVYERFGIASMNVETFEMILDGEKIETWRDKGGKYVEIDPELLRNYRKEAGYTQEELAKLAGVSKKTIYIHENRIERAPVNLVKKLEKILGRSVKREINVFKIHFERCEPLTVFENFVSEKFESLGIITNFARKSPFDMIGKEKELIVSAVGENRRRIEYKIGKLEKFLEFSNLKGAVITTYKAEYDLPVISKDELEKIEDKEEFFELLDSR